MPCGALLLSLAMLETRPPIVRIGGPACRKSAGRAMPSGKALRFRHGKTEAVQCNSRSCLLV